MGAKSYQPRMWLGDKPTRKVEKNTIYQGDNLPIMKELESGKIDMIYIDPPFCAQSVFKGKAFGNEDNAPEFNDLWGGGVNSYIHWLKPRLRECHRLLSSKGVFCLHLDQNSVHYAKIELDKIFGYKNFVNDIIWWYGGAAKISNKFPQKFDTILIYSKENKHTFNPIFEPTPDYLLKRARKDNDGRLWVDQRLGVKGETLEKLRKEGRTFKTKSGGERRKQFLDEMQGKPIQNVWTLPIINSQAKERLGYPTQKPLALLDRLIKAFTNKGDLVGDFFCGCGTTTSSAQNLGRAWVGGDISKDAIKVIKDRMKNDHNLRIKILKPNQLSTKDVMRLDPFEFESHVVSLIGQPNLKQRGDGGVDGYTYDHVPIQVKKSYKIGRPVLDGFYKHIQKRGAGIIIAHSFSKGLIEEKMKLENENGWVIDLIETRDLLRDAA